MANDTMVSYELSDGVATIAMDDGKANVMSQAMHRSLGAALDRAEADDAVVLLTGREGLFSAGYDRALFSRPQPEIIETIRAGGELAVRLFSFPRPVVAACTGHAVAQGAFLLLATDARVGASGGFRFGLNEVAIGLTIPHYGVELARHRLTNPAFHLATVTGMFFSPEEARAAGFVDRLVEAADVRSAALAVAKALTAIDKAAHAGTKARVRAPALARMRTGILEPAANSE